MPADAAVVRRLAAAIGRGAQGLALARTLAAEGVRTRAGLRRAAVLARLPREARANVLYNPSRNTPLATAEALAEEVTRRLVCGGGGDGGAAPRRFKVLPVGSVRRRAPRVKDLDFLIVAPDLASAERALAGVALRPEPGRADPAEIVDTYAAGARRRSTVLWKGGRHYRADFFVTTRAEKPFALFHFTGSTRYNIRTRAHAKRRGWTLNQYGLFESGSRSRVRGSAAVRTERDLARFLGVTYRDPTDREA